MCYVSELCTIFLWTKIEMFNWTCFLKVYLHQGARGVKSGNRDGKVGGKWKSYSLYWVGWGWTKCKCLSLLPSAVRLIISSRGINYTIPYEPRWYFKWAVYKRDVYVFFSDYVLGTTTDDKVTHSAINQNAVLKWPKKHGVGGSGHRDTPRRPTTPCNENSKIGWGWLQRGWIYSHRRGH